MAAPTEAELKARVEALESQLAAKEEALKAKEASFEEALVRDQQKTQEREQKEAAKREELNQRVLSLVEERARLNAELEILRERDVECKKMEEKYDAARKDALELRLRQSEDKKNLEESLEDRRHCVERQQGEIADLRCQISVLEHKVQHYNAKFLQQESLAAELAKQQRAMQNLQERVDSAERALKTENARFTRDRKALEEKVERLGNELQQEKLGPSKVELVAKYQSLIETRTQQLQSCMMLCCKVGGPMCPHDMTDNDQIARFLAKMEAFVTRQNRPTVETEVDEAQIRKLAQALSKLDLDKQLVLLKRFHDCVDANVEGSRRFGDTSGFPHYDDDPVALVNQIANVTAERDALLQRLREGYQSPGLYQSVRGSSSNLAEKEKDVPTTAEQEKDPNRPPLRSSPQSRAAASRKARFGSI